VYAILGALVLLSLPRGRRWWIGVAIAVAIASAYGITDEFHQSFVPGRVPDIADWAVDTAGALTAALLLEAAARTRSRRQ
jgi:VanZ family protein